MVVRVDCGGVVVPARSTKRVLRPHGTYAAAVRHRRRGQVLCGACRLALRVFERERKRAYRARMKGEPE